MSGNNFDFDIGTSISTCSERIHVFGESCWQTCPDCRRMAIVPRSEVGTARPGTRGSGSVETHVIAVELANTKVIRAQ
eukprot:1200084-Amphidinium_carterae.2